MTAVSVPDGVDAAALVANLRTEHGVVISGGQASLAGKIFRIGHMGRTTEGEIQETLAAIGDVLPWVGFGG